MAVLGVFILVVALSATQSLLAQYEAKIVGFIVPAVWVICMLLIYYFSDTFNIVDLIIATPIGILILCIARARELKNRRENNQ